MEANRTVICKRCGGPTGPDDDVTNFEGEPAAVGRLFEEPIGFAEREGLAVEAVVPSDGRATGVIESLGFEALGSGPRIEGEPTTRYRFEPGEG